MLYYLFVIADSVITSLGVLLVFSICCIYLGFRIWDIDEKGDCGLIKFGVITFFLSLIGMTFIPTTKQLAAIYLLPKIVENKNITQIPNNVANLANEWIKELSPSKKGLK